MTGDDARREGASTPEETRPTRPTTPGAAAARRARRIGGSNAGRPSLLRSGTATTPQAPADPASAPEQPAVIEPAAPVEPPPPAARPAPGVATANPAPDPYAVPPRASRPVPGRTGAPAGARPRPAAGPGRPAGRPTRRRWLWWTPFTVLAAAVVTVAVLLVIALLPGGADGNANRDRVLAAAKNCLVQTNTYNYKDINGFVRRGQACATGDFAKVFTATIDDIIRKIAPSTHQQQALQVNTAGVVSTSTDTWQIMIYGQVHVTNDATGSDGRTDLYGALLTMKLVRGSWVISNEQALCSTDLINQNQKCS